MVIRKPISQCVLPAHVARQTIGLSSTKHWLKDGPYGVRNPQDGLFEDSA
jgi:hypothetical protein